MNVVGYIYRADIFCPGCLLAALPTGEGEAFDGWADCSIPPMTAEQNLDEIAYAFGIDRTDEWSFDSGDFPKVILSLDDAARDQCGQCGQVLREVDA